MRSFYSVICAGKIDQIKICGLVCRLFQGYKSSASSFTGKSLLFLVKRILCFLLVTWPTNIGKFEIVWILMQFLSLFLLYVACNAANYNLSAYKKLLLKHSMNSQEDGIYVMKSGFVDYCK